MYRKLPALGKIHPQFFNTVIFPRLGATSSATLIGPRHGVDFGAIEVGGKVIAISTDPFFIAPALGWERAAWFAVHILASDVAVSGIMPTHLCIDLNLPPETDERILRRMWLMVHRECKKMGITIISGHTARYAGCAYPMVGGAVMFGVGDRTSLRDPKNVRPGDLIVITKGPAVEAAGLMAAQFPEFLEERYGERFVKLARGIFARMSTVLDAQVASGVKGVVAMHDATECGIMGGLYEMADAGGWGLEVWKDMIVFDDTVRKVCECFDLEPYNAISEGTMIAVVREKAAKRLISLLEAAAIPSSIAGRILPRSKGMTIVERRRTRSLAHPREDPFWPCFEKYLAIQKKPLSMNRAR